MSAKNVNEGGFTYPIDEGIVNAQESHFQDLFAPLMHSLDLSDCISEMSCSLEDFNALYPSDVRTFSVVGSRMTQIILNPARLARGNFFLHTASLRHRSAREFGALAHGVMHMLTDRNERLLNILVDEKLDFNDVPFTHLLWLEEARSLFRLLSVSSSFAPYLILDFTLRSEWDYQEYDNLHYARYTRNFPLWVQGFVLSQYIAGRYNFDEINNEMRTDMGVEQYEVMSSLILKFVSSTQHLLSLETFDVARRLQKLLPELPIMRCASLGYSGSTDMPIPGNSTHSNERIESIVQEAFNAIEESLPRDNTSEMRESLVQETMMLNATIARAAERSLNAETAYTREVTPAEEAFTARLTRSLSQARFAQVTDTEIFSLTPPKRLHVRELARREAQIAMHARITATPWSRRMRRERNIPPLFVGTIVDASTSMRNFVPPALSMGWSLSKAAHNLGGAGITLAFASRVAELVNSRTSDLSRLPRSVEVGASTVALGDALQAMIETLVPEHYEHNSAELITILSDGKIPTGIRDDVQDKIDTLNDRGARVLWFLVPSNGNLWIPSNVLHETISSENDIMDSYERLIIRMLNMME